MGRRISRAVRRPPEWVPTCTIACAVGLLLISSGPAVRPAFASGPRLGDEWIARYDDPTNGDDSAIALAVSDDGAKVFVTGYSRGSLTDYATVAYDAGTGRALWVSRYDSGDDLASDVAVSPDGSKVFVTGSSAPSGPADYLTVAYDAATGARLWIRRYSRAPLYSSGAKAIESSPDGSKVFVTGGSAGAYTTIAYDSATGARQWVSRYDGPASRTSVAHDLVVSPDGSKLFVTGESIGTSSLDYATLALDADTGARLWAQRYDGTIGAGDRATAVAVSPDGATVVVTGESNSVDFFHSDCATIGYEASTGRERWSDVYDGPASQADACVDVALTPDGTRAVVTGSSDGGATRIDAVTIAYDAATGSTLWLTRYNGPSNRGDVGEALAVRPDGSEVVITAASFKFSTSDDYVTLGYDTSTGAELWSRRYDGPLHGVDDPTAIGISPDGASAFVTGSSVSRDDNGSTYDDFATIGYLMP